MDVHSLLKEPRGHRAVVVGGGKTGAAAARLLVRLGALVTVVDDAPADKVKSGLEKGGLDPASVTLVAGGLDAAIIDAAELIVLSPGVPRAHPALAAALARGTPCINEVELAAARLGPAVRTIGITGTNGKSTTTTMCGAIAKAYDAHAFVGGNLGTPYCTAALECLDGKPAPRIAVLELSSYQLETIRELPLNAAVVTNLSPDHLDRYPNAAAYYTAKARIFDLVRDGGGISLNAADAETRTHLVPAVPGTRARCDFDISRDVGVHIDGARLLVDGDHAGERGGHWEVSLENPYIVGHHNKQNAAAAVAAAVLANIPPAFWQAGLNAYAGIAHRLERIGERGGVAWFNDSKGTNVDATVTAVKSFSGGVHLIAGGLGKGAPYQPLVDVSRGKVVTVYTIGQDAAAIEAAFKGVIEVVPCGTLEVACEKASARARPGEVLLLSPACASFDQFRDYAHRGESFRNLFQSTSSPSSSTSSSEVKG